MKQKGIVRLEGTYDDVTFYSSRGKDLARKKGGISRNRMYNDPAFERQRANFSEFGASCLVGKVIRDALIRELRGFSGGNSVQELNRILRRLVRQGAGLRGHRAFEFTANKHMLKGFEFRNKDPLSNLISVELALSSVAARNEVTLTVPDFDTRNSMQPPVGSTHFRLILSIGTVSDYIYTDDVGYHAANPTEDKLKAVVVSAKIPIGTMVGAITTLTAQLPGLPAISANTTLLAAVGIEFVEEINGVDYVVPNGKSMQLAELF